MSFAIVCIAIDRVKTVFDMMAMKKSGRLAVSDHKLRCTKALSFLIFYVLGTTAGRLGSRLRLVKEAKSVLTLKSRAYMAKFLMVLELSCSKKLKEANFVLTLKSRVIWPSF